MTKITHLSLLIFMFCSTLAFSKSNSVNTNSSEATYSTTEIQRVRIYFTTPLGFVRHLLLAFTPDDSATDSYNYGYDALNRDDLPDDLSWMIGDNEFVIQGVGAFDIDKKYRLGMFLTNSGSVKIDLLRTENFDNPINVFIYDSELDTYTDIKDQTYTEDMNSGEFVDRFYIAFKNSSTDQSAAKSTLSNEDFLEESAQISYIKNTNELLISMPNDTQINKIGLYNIKGQLILEKKTNHFIHTNRVALSDLKIGAGIVYIETNRGILSKKVLIH